MLIVFFGPTGAGKSTMMKFLHDFHGLRMIEVVTTRPPRAHDPGRRSVSEAEYNQLEFSDRLVWSNTVHGFRYGTPRSDVREAVKSPRPSHVLDFSIENISKIEQLLGYRAGILLLPEWPVIVSRLDHEDRADRLAVAKWQYDACEDYIENPASVIGDRVVRSSEIIDAQRCILEILTNLDW